MASVGRLCSIQFELDANDKLYMFRSKAKGSIFTHSNLFYNTPLVRGIFVQTMIRIVKKGGKIFIATLPINGWEN